MNRELSVSILDQALMSAFNLALNLVLIALAAPEEFGLFVIVFAAMLVVLAVQHALINHPLNFLLPGRDAQTQAAQLAMLTDMNRPVIAFSLVVAAGVAWMYATSLPLVLAIGFYLYTSAVRTYTRDIFIVTNKMTLAFAQDIVLVLVAGGAIVLLWGVTDKVTAVVAGLGIANLVSMMAFRPEIPRPRGKFMQHLAEYRTVWVYSRWALLSAVQTETQTRGYIFVTEAWKGAAVLGTLQVGRMLLAPLMLITMAWGRVARPRMVAHLHKGRPREAYAILGKGLALILAMSVVYGAAIAASWPLIEHYIFRDRYDDMAAMAMIWWAYTTLAALNGCGATLMEARRAYRALAMLEMVTAATCLAALVALSLTELPAISVVITLAVVQAVYAVGMAFLVLRSDAAGKPHAAAMSESGVPL